MVREVGHVAAAFALLAALALPCNALAEDDEGVTSYTGAPVSAPSLDYSSRFDSLDGAVSVLNGNLAIQQETLDRHLTNIEQLLTPEPEVPKDENAKDELDYLISIDDKLSEITLKDTVENEVQPITREGAKAASVTLTAYANSPATGTYATYALGMLPRVGFNEHYVFVQDTQSSYVFAWGELSPTSSTAISGTGSWVRWYNAGTQIGYVQESGTGSVTVNTGNHIVISDLQGRPMLTGSNSEVVRKEVGFYAQVACVLFSLATVWAFLLRMRSGTA